MCCLCCDFVPLTMLYSTDVEWVPFLCSLLGVGLGGQCYWLKVLGMHRATPCEATHTVSLQPTSQRLTSSPLFIGVRKVDWVFVRI